jgi:hypothetical protein
VCFTLTLVSELDTPQVDRQLFGRHYTRHPPVVWVKSGVTEGVQNSLRPGRLCRDMCARVVCSKLVVAVSKLSFRLASTHLSLRFLPWSRPLPLLQQPFNHR